MGPVGHAPIALAAGEDAEGLTANRGSRPAPSLTEVTSDPLRDGNAGRR